MTALPEGWETATIGEIGAEMRTGFASGRHNAIGTGIPHLRPMNVSRLGVIDLDELKYVDPGVDDRRLVPGDILFNNTNSPALVGKTALFALSGEYAFSNHMTRVRVSPGIEPRFVAMQLHYLWRTGQLSHLITNHVNQASISAKALSAQVTVVLPPQAEQERIVAAIEEHLSRLDAAESCLKRSAEKFDLLRKAAISEAMTSRADSFVRWGDVGTTLSGRTFPSSAYTDAGTPLLRPGNLDRSGRVTWTSAATRFLPAEFEFQYPKYVLEGTHLLMNLTAQSLADDFLGRVCLSSSDDRYLLNQRIARLSSDVASPRYLYWVFRSLLFRRFVAGLNSGSLIQHISTKQLDDFSFPLLPESEQMLVVERIEREVAAIDALEWAVLTNLRRAAPLRSRLLAAAFAGQLVKQDPTDDPVGVARSNSG